MAGLIFGVDTGLWKLMAANGDRSQTISELATKLGVEPLLLGQSCRKMTDIKLIRPLGRLMRHLAAMGYVTETGVDKFKPTNYTKAMSLDVISGGYIGLYIPLFYEHNYISD